MPQPLIPTLKERNRYIAFEVVSNSKFERNEIVKGLWSGVLDFLGELGAGRTSMWVMDWDDKTNCGTIRTNHKSVDEIKAALTLIRSVNNKKVLIHILVVSGTLKCARKHISMHLKS